MAIQTVTATAECPECAETIELVNVQQNEVGNCPTCRWEYEVRSINPVRLEPAPEEEEDFGE